MFWRYLFCFLALLGCTSVQRFPAQLTVNGSHCLDGVNVFSEFANQTKKNLFDIAVKIRSTRKLTDARVGHKIKINNHEYHFLSLLGTSNASVYLAKDERGKLFSIKMDALVPRHDTDGKGWMAQTWWYEKYKTKFYESMNLPVAHIHGLDARTDEPIIIKEYIFGLTFDEIKNNKGLFPPNHAYHLMRQLADRIFEFRDVERKFTPWLLEHQYDPSKLLSGRELLNTKDFIHRQFGDVREDNFIFDVVREKWVCIDP